MASSTCVRSVSEVVTAGQPIVTLINPDDLWFAATSRKLYRSRSKRRQDARAAALRRGKSTVFYRGVDASFATQRDVSRTKRDIKTFEVRLRIDNHDRRLAVSQTAYSPARVMSAIDVRAIVKKFGDFTAVNGISFTVEGRDLRPARRTAPASRRSSV